MSRIESARERAGATKRALAVLAALGLVGAGLVARATNPAHAARASRSIGSSSGVTSSGAERDSSDAGFSIAPSTSQPQVQTHVS